VPPNEHGDELPPPDTCRWPAGRKAAVVRALRDGRLTVDGACARYRGLSLEELASWERAYDRGGHSGLKLRNLQAHRSGWRGADLG
jgi:hypothetical protein